MSKFTLPLLAISVFVSTPAMSADSAGQWQGSIARLIASHQNYPRSAQIRGEQGTSRLRVAISPDGRIDQVDIAASSGSAILDREAQSMVSKIGKLPAPPPGTRTLLIPIVWRLD